MPPKQDLQNYYALLIGVGGEEMEATIADATALQKVISNPKLAGYPKKNVFLLTESTASKANVLKHLELLAEKTKGTEDATVFIYYSGHGGRFVAGEGSKDFNYYLLTHGFDLENIEDTMLNGELFSNKVDAIKAKKLIVLLDCCHAAGIKEKKITIRKKGIAAAGPKTKIQFSGAELIKQLKGGEGRVFISSCQDNEESVILPGAENSLFTQVALEALKGEVSRTEFVKVIDLMYLLLNDVPERVKAYDHPQNPVINEVKNLSSSYYLCLNGKKALVSKSRGLTSKNPELSDEHKMSLIKNYKNQININ